MEKKEKEKGNKLAWEEDPEVCALPFSLPSVVSVYILLLSYQNHNFNFFNKNVKSLSNQLVEMIVTHKI